MIMVFFHDFNIKVITKKLGRFFGEFHLQIYAQRHIRGKKYGDMSGVFCDHHFVVGRIACGGEYNSNIFGLRKLKQAKERLRTRKINDHVYRVDDVRKIFIDRKRIVMRLRHFIHAGHDHHIFRLGYAGCERLSETPVYTAQ